MAHPIFNRFLLAGAVLAALAATPAWADDQQPAPGADYAPSAANGCGRLKPVYLPVIPSTRYHAPYPEDARDRHQKGHVMLRVLVDKYGFARHPEVVISSGYAQLDQASIDSIQDRWRWEAPPPECAESGVIMSVSYDWGLYWAIGGKSEDVPRPVYLDNPLYPAEARKYQQGGKGEVEYTISPDNKVSSARVLSSAGSPALDAAMIALIQDWSFPNHGTSSTSYTGRQRFEFIAHDDPDTRKALMGPAIVPDPQYLPGTPPPI
jgi:TonB family protein